MKYIFFLVNFILFGSLLFGQNEINWPILKHYDQAHLLNIALPQRVIGCITVTKENNAPFFSIWILK
jgi:non-lysosomal glucosylceramidase